MAQDGGRDAWFPDAEYFSRPTASVREPTFGLRLLWSDVFRDRADPAERPPFDLQGGSGLETDLQGEAALGGNVRIWQPAQWADGGLTLGIQAGVFGRFRLEVTGNDLVASDWIVALPAEIARGEKGVYFVDTGIATLTGAVKITRGDNQLNGEIAEINMNTGVSRILAGAGKGGESKPVRALIIPAKKSAKKPAANSKKRSEKINN